MSYVVAVAAPIGGGKSSLVRALAQALGDAATIHFDHYERATDKSVAELVEWMGRGADFDELSAPNLARDLAALKGGASVVDPLTQAEIAPGRYVVFEMPLGREYSATAPLINVLIWVDVPLDIALARKLKEFTGSFLSRQQGAPQEFVVWVDNYLDHYLTVIRDVLGIQQTRVRAKADVVVDGRNSLEVMVQQAMQEIMKRCQEPLP